LISFRRQEEVCNVYCSSSSNPRCFKEARVHTRGGDHFFANFNLTILDDVPVTIGDDVQLGPGVSLIAGTHPLLFEERRRLTYPDGHVGGAEYGDPIVIGDRVWLGANVTVMPGVTVGEGANPCDVMTCKKAQPILPRQTCAARNLLFNIQVFTAQYFRLLKLS